MPSLFFFIVTFLSCTIRLILLIVLVGLFCLFSVTFLSPVPYDTTINSKEELYSSRAIFRSIPEVLKVRWGLCLMC